MSTVNQHSDLERVLQSVDVLFCEEAIGEALNCYRKLWAAPVFFRNSSPFLPSFPAYVMNKLGWLDWFCRLRINKYFCELGLDCLICWLNQLKSVPFNLLYCFVHRYQNSGVRVICLIEWPDGVAPQSQLDFMWVWRIFLLRKSLNSSIGWRKRDFCLFEWKDGKQYPQCIFLFLFSFAWN
jgi:hypothetical protein